jgi:hypothetical protein
MAETLMRGLFADVQHSPDLCPGRTLLATDLYHFCDAVGHHHLQGVEPPQNVQFPNSAVGWSVHDHLELESPQRLIR